MDTLDILRRHDLVGNLVSDAVVRNGHFAYNRFTRHEQHGSLYVDTRAIFRDYTVALQAIQGLFTAIPADILDQVDVVAGPATGGAVIAFTLSSFLAARRDIHRNIVGTVFLGNSTDYEGFHDLDQMDRATIMGKRILLVDDVRHFGRTLAVSAGVLMAAGGKVLATAQLIDRSEVTMPTPGVPNYWLMSLPKAELFKPSECPMCKEKVPLTVL